MADHRPPLIQHAIAGAFQSVECDAIIGLAPSAMENAPVWTGSNYALHADARNVDTLLLDRTSETSWLFSRLDALLSAAANSFALSVGPIVEPVQLLRYRPGCHFQQWHSDAGLDAKDKRRLSFSVELSERGDYQGGDLEIAPDVMGARTLARGSARIFLSQALHRVTPVLEGTRWALVGWTGGPDAAY